VGFFGCQQGDPPALYILIICEPEFELRDRELIREFFQGLTTYIVPGSARSGQIGTGAARLAHLIRQEHEGGCGAEEA
jgi:hypothetical protein